MWHPRVLVAVGLCLMVLLLASHNSRAAHQLRVKRLPRTNHHHSQASTSKVDSDWPHCSPVASGGTEKSDRLRRSQRHWVFCHMPKTGGMTMRTVLERGARADGHSVTHLAKNYDRPRCRSGPTGSSHCRGILGTQSLAQLRQDFAHLDPNLKPTLFTMLREPVERSYSAYHYVLREPNKPIHGLYKANTLEALLRGQRFYNDIGLGTSTGSLVRVFDSEGMLMRKPQAVTPTPGCCRTCCRNRPSSAAKSTKSTLGNGAIDSRTTGTGTVCYRWPSGC